MDEDIMWVFGAILVASGFVFGIVKLVNYYDDRYNNNPANCTEYIHLRSVESSGRYDGKYICPNVAHSAKLNTAERTVTCTCAK